MKKPPPWLKSTPPSSPSAFEKYFEHDMKYYSKEYQSKLMVSWDPVKDDSSSHTFTTEQLKAATTNFEKLMAEKLAYNSPMMFLDECAIPTEAELKSRWDEGVTRLNKLSKDQLLEKLEHADRKIAELEAELKREKNISSQREMVVKERYLEGKKICDERDQYKKDLERAIDMLMNYGLVGDTNCWCPFCQDKVKGNPGGGKMTMTLKQVGHTITHSDWKCSVCGKPAQLLTGLDLVFMCKEVSRLAKMVQERDIEVLNLQDERLKHCSEYSLRIQSAVAIIRKLRRQGVKLHYRSATQSQGRAVRSIGV